MSYQQTICYVEETLNEVFNLLDECFQLPPELRQFKPTEGEWSIDEILEHVTLTNRFLMLVIRKSRDKALRKAKNQPIPDGESELQDIASIGHPDAFPWIRPEHMEPTGEKLSGELQETMRNQQQECLEFLSQLSKGEGALHRVRMSVQELGKLDIYQWIFFLAQHGNRHFVEIERIQNAWEGKPT